MVAQGSILSGRYLIEAELGAGGMGTVFRAVDLRTGGNVAVKAPHAFLTRDRNYVERLRREAMIAASLQSPRIARVTDLAEHDGTPYLVMEYVPGETLANVIDREGPLAPERALRIALEVARALDAAHQRGIVHRDLKPQNIHVDNDDVKVLDFGIARLQGLSSLTGAGTLLGSPEYTAPERMDGMGDIRGDIYALGVVLYEMLSGRLPFSGDTPWRLLQRHASEPPPPLPAGLPTAVYPIVERCLAKRPEDRYATPRDLAVALQHAARLVDGETGAATVAAPPPSSAQIRLPTPPDFAPRPANGGAAPPAPARPHTPEFAAAPLPVAHQPRRTPRVLAGLGALALAAVAVALVLALRGGAAPGPLRVIGGAVPSAGGGATLPAGRPTLEVAFPAEGAQVQAPVRLEVKVVGTTLKAPTDGDASAHHLHYFIDTDPAAVYGAGQPVPTGARNIIHTPETSLLLDLTPGAHTVWVVLTDNNHLPFDQSIQAKVSFTLTGTPARPGEQAPIVYQSLQDGRWRLFVMDGNGRNPRRITTGAWNDVEPAWSADGSRVVFASDRDGRYHLYVMNPDGSGVQQLTRGAGQERNPVWAPSGDQIAFHSDRDGTRDQIFVVPAAGGEARQVTRGSEGGSQPTWSADGKQIAFVRQQGNESHIYTVDVEGGETRRLTTAARRHIDPAWSPDGRRIAFAAFQDNRWNIFVMGIDGSGVQRVTSGDPQDRFPAWSPDGRQLVFASGRDGQMQVFVLPLDSTQTRTLTEGLAHNWRPSWPRR